MNEIYFVGYDGIHPDDFKYDIPEGFPGYLLLLTSTPALFQVQGNIREYPAHTAILYPPHHAVWYAASGTGYADSWLRFSSDESFVTNFPRKAVPFSVSDPEYCRNLFQLLTWESSPLISTSRRYHNTGLLTSERDAHLPHRNFDSDQSSLVISQLLRILFRQLSNDVLDSASSPYDCALLALRRRIAANPQLSWNVRDMAAELHISSGYLQILYKKKFGVSCMDDVISLRLCKARDLLTYTTDSISQIAAQCGYNSTEHFCRQFKACTAQTPGRYREHTCAIHRKT